MTRLLIIIAFHSISFSAFCQLKDTSCECSVMLDPEFKGSIKVFDYPNGKVVKKIMHNFQEEDFIVFTIKAKRKGFFKVSAEYSINGHIVDGWIKNGNPLGVYARNYDNNRLNFFNLPTRTKEPDYTVKNFEKVFFRISDCGTKGWIKVRFKYNGKDLEGWMPKDEQCDNPYTTCN